jgi:hypothetical protein
LLLHFTDRRQIFPRFLKLQLNPTFHFYGTPITDPYRLKAMKGVENSEGEILEEQV